MKKVCTFYISIITSTINYFLSSFEFIAYESSNMLVINQKISMYTVASIYILFQVNILVSDR